MGLGIRKGVGVGQVDVFCFRLMYVHGAYE